MSKKKIMLWAFVLALALPMMVALLLRRRGAIWNFGATAWVFGLGMLDGHGNDQRLIIYALCGLGAIGLIAWGVKEVEKNYINIGVPGFAITVIVFYFSNVLDKLGRSFALILFGVIFLVGGYLLERMRRKLVARLAGGAA